MRDQNIDTEAGFSNISNGLTGGNETISLQNATIRGCDILVPRNCTEQSLTTVATTYHVERCMFAGIEPRISP